MASLLRARDGERAEVTSVELFFDLVFVITVSQISHSLLEDLTWLGALHAAMLLVAIWWAWIDTAWITNWLDPHRMPVRLMLFLLMGIGLVLSSSLPEAFGERGFWFALAFVLFQVGRTAFMLWAVRSEPVQRMNFIRISVWVLASSVVWLAGGLAEGNARLVLWLVALAMDTSAPAAAFYVPGLGRTDTKVWNVEGGHMAERSGLFVMIALGESVLATGVGFTALQWTPEVVLAMAASLIASIAMWNIYFGQHADLALEASANADDPGAVARRAYTYAPILLIAGIIVAAVGDDLVLQHPLGEMDAAAALVMVGGPLLFLFGALLFKLAMFHVWSAPRLVGLVVLVLLYPVATLLSPLLLSIATSLVLVVIAVYEIVWFARHPEIAEEMPTALKDEN
jgi:low temperature requirement protein LtrA